MVNFDYGSGHSSTLSILRSFSGLKQRCIFLSFSLLNSSGLSQGSLLMPAMSEPMPSSLTRCESLSSCCITSDSSMMTAVTSERFTEQLRCTSLASWSVSMVPMFTACGNHFPGCAVCVLVSFDILYIIAMLFKFEVSVYYSHSSFLLGVSGSYRKLLGVIGRYFCPWTIVRYCVPHSYL